MRTGTRLIDLLPAEVDGAVVVAGLLGQKPVSLSTPIITEASVAPLTVSHWEGRQIYAHSLGLLLLEAAHQVAPGAPRPHGARRAGRTRSWTSRATAPADRAGVAERIGEAMRKLAALDAPIRLEFWATDEAQTWFRERGWDDAARLLRIRRQATVRLVSCGEVYALSMGPLLPSHRAAARVPARGRTRDGLALRAREDRPAERAARAAAASAAGAAPAREPRRPDMPAEHQRWLAAMGVTSVGAFNELCISGQVSQLIRVAEGFHEKRIGQIADQIAAARDRIRIISIAGPSSSGKTTFIKRLTVQLQIDGVNPVGISLDDYYVDREKTPRGAERRLGLRGARGARPRAPAGARAPAPRGRGGEDRRATTSSPGRATRTAARPSSSGPATSSCSRGSTGSTRGSSARSRARASCTGSSSTRRRRCPFDRLTRVSSTDLRLLRRIVRDRHQRGYGAAANIVRWPSVQAGEREHIYPFQGEADAVFDAALVYEPAVLKVYAERYLLEVPQDHPAYPTAHRLRYLVDRFVSIYPDHVPPTSLLREFIGGSGFEY